MRPERSRGGTGKRKRKTALRGKTVARRRRKSRRLVVVTISWERLRRMHDEVKALCHRKGAGPGTEEHSLLASLGACLGNWPRLKESKTEELKERYGKLLGTPVPYRPRRSLKEGRPEKVDRRGLPCMRCEELYPADDFQCLYGNYWLCPGCARYHRGIAERHGVQC